MALNPMQQLSADVLALRILLGQLIVRLAAGSKDPAQTIKIMRDGANATATNASLRDLPDATVEDVRKYMEGTIDRFFAAMRINGQPPGSAPVEAPAEAPAAAPRAAPAKAKASPKK